MIAIAAMTSDRVIGRDGTIPWRVPGELAFFKATTLGNVVVMGRKTYDSIGKPLPGRENIVISRQMQPIEGVNVIASPDDVPDPGPRRRTYIIGGAAIYAALLPRCDELLLTLVDRQVAGDTFFPPFEDTFQQEEIVAAGEGWTAWRYVRRRPREEQ